MFNAHASFCVCAGLCEVCTRECPHRIDKMAPMINDRVNFGDRPCTTFASTKIQRRYFIPSRRAKKQVNLKANVVLMRRANDSFKRFLFNEAATFNKSEFFFFFFFSLSHRRKSQHELKTNYVATVMTASCTPYWHNTKQRNSNAEPSGHFVRLS